VFGVTTVIGPLLGGVFTDNLSWRWVFYINVPIAVIVIALAARTIPQLSSGRKPVIDYLGCPFVALGATGLTLATSWGGTQYGWGSATIIGLFAASVAASRATHGSRTRWNPGHEPTRTMPHRPGPNRDSATSSRSSGPAEDRHGQGTADLAAGVEHAAGHPGLVAGDAVQQDGGHRRHDQRAGQPGQHHQPGQRPDRRRGRQEGGPGDQGRQAAQAREAMAHHEREPVVASSVITKKPSRAADRVWPEPARVSRLTYDRVRVDTVLPNHPARAGGRAWYWGYWQGLFRRRAAA
jgi:hypothetical protein